MLNEPADLAYTKQNFDPTGWTCPNKGLSPLCSVVVLFSPLALSLSLSLVNTNLISKALIETSDEEKLIWAKSTDQLWLCNVGRKQKKTGNVEGNEKKQYIQVSATEEGRRGREREDQCKPIMFLCQGDKAK